MARLIAGGAALLLTGACASVQPGPAAVRTSPVRVTPEVMASAAFFDAALQASNTYDMRGAWRGHECRDVARQFRAAYRADPLLREALFNASVAELRCRRIEAPQQRHLASVAMRHRPYEGFVRLTPVASRRSPTDVARALVEASHIDVGSSADPTMLAELASLHTERGYWSASANDAARDFATAQSYVERALMIDERAAPARTQLVLLHLARAQQAGRSAASALQLERALGVALQVVREHPMFAPARNAMGLVAYELRDTAEAVRQFALAASLQPADVQTYTNWGGALLSARSFADAQRAYEAALTLDPSGYEAHLGRAAALGAQIDHTAHWPTEFARVQSELAHCKQIAPDRPEAYYNEAWLHLASHARSSGLPARMAALRAQTSFDTFIVKAGLLPAYAQEVQSARAKLGELGARRPGSLRR